MTDKANLSLAKPEPEEDKDNPFPDDGIPLQSTESTTTPEATPTVVKEPEKPVDAVLDAILGAKRSTVEAKEWLKILIYSLPDAGKTSFLGTIPNNFIIDSEDGLVSHRQLKKMGLLAPNVQMLPYRSFEGFENIVKKFAENPPELMDHDKFSIDTLSTLHKRGLEEVTVRKWNQNKIANNKYVAETDDHTENNEHIRRIVDSLTQMPKHVIVTAHARTVEPKVGPTKTFPDFSEKLANTLAGMVDVVGYLYVKEVGGDLKRILRLKSDGSITAKNRIGLPFEIEDPTWDKIYEAFLEGKED